MNTRDDWNDLNFSEIVATLKRHARILLLAPIAASLTAMLVAALAIPKKYAYNGLLEIPIVPVALSTQAGVSTKHARTHLVGLEEIFDILDYNFMRKPRGVAQLEKYYSASKDAHLLSLTVVGPSPEAAKAELDKIETFLRDKYKGPFEAALTYNQQSLKAMEAQVVSLQKSLSEVESLAKLRNDTQTNHLLALRKATIQNDIEKSTLQKLQLLTSSSPAYARNFQITAARPAPTSPDLLKVAILGAALGLLSALIFGFAVDALRKQPPQS